jgi:hypothetical protein
LAKCPGARSRAIAADEAIEGRLKAWIDGGVISKTNPMTRTQYYEFMNQARALPEVDSFITSINDFESNARAQGIDPKFRRAVAPKMRGGGDD